MKSKSNVRKTNGKFGIIIYSKYSGEPTTLGRDYNTREEAVKESKKICCSRCNRIEIIHIPFNSIWIDKNQGFISKERFEEYKKEEVLKSFNRY